MPKLIEEYVLDDQNASEDEKLEKLGLKLKNLIDDEEKMRETDDYPNYSLIP